MEQDKVKHNSIEQYKNKCYIHNAKQSVTATNIAHTTARTTAHNKVQNQLCRTDRNVRSPGGEHTRKQYT